MLLDSNPGDGGKVKSRWKLGLCVASLLVAGSPTALASAQELPCIEDCGPPPGGHCENTSGTPFRGNSHLEYTTNPNRVRACDFRGTPIAVNCFDASGTLVSTVTVVYWDDKQCAGWVPY